VKVGIVSKVFWTFSAAANSGSNQRNRLPNFMNAGTVSATKSKPTPPRICMKSWIWTPRRKKYSKLVFGSNLAMMSISRFWSTR